MIFKNNLDWEYLPIFNWQLTNLLLTIVSIMKFFEAGAIDKRSEAVRNSIHKSTHLTSSDYIPSLRGLSSNPHVT